MANTERGFSLVELLLALALAAFALTLFIDTIAYTERTGADAFAQTQARLRAGECLEAARWIRDADGFDALADGTYGMRLASGRWELAGAPDEIGGFTRTLDIAAYADDTAMLTCTVGWDEDDSSRSFGLTTLLSR